jgi:hydrophobe/amphiphile efflux-1 (HAE1) family protein
MSEKAPSRGDDTRTEQAARAGGVTALSIRRPIGVLSVASVVIVLGLFYLQRLPVDLLPEIAYPEIRVNVNYPGTAPEVMEQQVTRVLERNLAGTENLISIQSSTSEGRSHVTLFFDLGTDLDIALQDASRLLERSRPQLPPDVDPPRLFKMDPSQMPVYEAGFSSTMRSEVDVRDWLDNQLSPQLLSIPGIGSVEVAGGQVRELQVIVDQDRLAAHGLTMRDVVAAVQAENRDIAAGNLTSPSFDVMAKTDGRFRSVADIEAVLVPLPNRRDRLRLGELAEVRDGHAEQRLFVRLNGEPAVRMTVSKLPGANTVAVVGAINREMRRLSASGFIPPDMTYQATRDPSFFILSSIRAVSTAAVLGATLAMMVVLLFLGSLRKSFVIGLSIPIALMATFAMMGAGNLTLNIMSLGGLALGVGLLLDNSIVMLENIFRHRESLGKSAESSAVDGSREVSSAVVAATLTNLAAVVPFLLITGLAALIFRELILTISFAIVASLGVALTLVPTLSALFSGVSFRSGLDSSRLIRGFDSAISRAAAGYKRLAIPVLRFRWGVVAVAALLIFGALTLGRGLGSEFLPQVDDGLVQVRLSLPPGTPPSQTDEAFRRIEGVVEQMPHVESVFTMAGGALWGGVISERSGMARASVQLVSARERPEMPASLWVRELESRVRALDIPGGRVGVSPPRIPGIRTTLSGADISIGIVGDDLRQLEAAGWAIVDRLEGTPGLLNFEFAREDRSPLLSVEVDRERAAALGLNVSEVGESIRHALFGVVPTRFSMGNAEYDIRVMLPRQRMATSDDLGGIRLFRANGRPVHVRDVARFSLGEGPATIDRENQVRILRINGEVDSGVSDIGTVNRQIRERLAGLELPSGLSMIYGGEEEAIRETNRNLFTVILLAVFLVFVVLAVQYERLSNPFVILTAVPLALVGVVAMLWATGTHLSAPVMLGVILLIGIVVNNAILLVEYVEIGRREHGLSPTEAVAEAGRIRFRPILMTTMTTVLGMTPLALGIGDGAELMRPLALAVIGGLLVSMALTLLLVPSLYLIVNGIAETLTGWVTGSAGEHPRVLPQARPRGVAARTAVGADTTDGHGVPLRADPRRA